MKKKIIPLLLAASLCVGLLAGCQSSELRSYTEQLDYTPCSEYYNADKVMLTVDGIDVTWAELFYWCMYYKDSVGQLYGQIRDWDDKSAADETKTNEEYVMDSALDTVRHYCAVESAAKEKGITLTDEDKTTLETTWKQNVQNYGGGDEAAFEEQLKKAYLTKDMYQHFNEVNLLYNRLLANMYGENGEKLTSDQVVQEANKLGYVRAKNLLISTKDDSGNALTGSALAQKKALADKLDAELKTITDQTALEKRFDELMAQYGADTGAQYYPDGYTYINGKGTMETSFETAVAAIKENQISDVVETSYGYDIILRLPLSADLTTVEVGSNNTAQKLGYSVAQSLFTNEAETWSKNAKVDYTRAYKKLKLSKVFAKAAVVSTASVSPTASQGSQSSSQAAESPAASAKSSPAATAEVSASPAA